MKWWAVAAAICYVTLSPGAHSVELVEGRDYIEIEPRPTSEVGPVEVLEFFFYGCTACYRLNPVMQEWLDRRDQQIGFQRIPALRRRAWIPLSDLFFALQALQAIPRLHARVYQAIHEQHWRLDSIRAQIDWASEQGIDSVLFEQTLKSDATKIATQQARDVTLAYDVRVTPTIVVDGRFVTNAELMGRASRVSLVLDQLVQMALEKRQQHEND